MRIKISAMILTILLMVLNIDAAHARRIRLPVVIPTGYVEKVVDLPDVPELKYKDGVYVDLGYYHYFIGGGKWVGYIGSSTRYIEFKEGALEALVAAGYLDEIPPEPKGINVFKYVPFILVVGLYFAVTRYLRGRPSAKAAQFALAEKEMTEKTDEIIPVGLQSRIDALAKQRAEALGLHGAQNANNEKPASMPQPEPAFGAYSGGMTTQEAMNAHGASLNSAAINRPMPNAHAMEQPVLNTHAMEQPMPSSMGMMHGNPAAMMYGNMASQMKGSHADLMNGASAEMASCQDPLPGATPAFGKRRI